MDGLNSTVSPWFCVDGDVEDVAGGIDGLGQTLVLGQLGWMLVEALLHFRRPSLHELIQIWHRVGVVHFRWRSLAVGVELNIARVWRKIAFTSRH